MERLLALNRDGPVPTQSLKFQRFGEPKYLEISIQMPPHLMSGLT